MSEPLSSSGAVVVTGVLGVASLLPIVNDGTLFAAFAGAVVFVLSARDYRWPERLIYLVVSVIAGVLCAHLAAGIIDALLPSEVVVPDSAGALVCSAVAVRLLQWVIRNADHPSTALPWRAEK